MSTSIETGSGAIDATDRAGISIDAADDAGTDAPIIVPARGLSKAQLEAASRVLDHARATVPPAVPVAETPALAPAGPPATAPPL